MSQLGDVNSNHNTVLHHFYLNNKDEENGQYLIVINK